MDLGQRIKKIRKEAGLTQTEFGNIFEPTAHKGVVSQWESGRNNPNPKRTKEIADFAGITVHELLHGFKHELIDK